MNNLDSVLFDVIFLRLCYRQVHVPNVINDFSGITLKHAMPKAVSILLACTASPIFLIYSIFLIQ
jgi:hypothetical protein